MKMKSLLYINWQNTPQNSPCFPINWTLFFSQIWWGMPNNNLWVVVKAVSFKDPKHKFSCKHFDLQAERKNSSVKSVAAGGNENQQTLRSLWQLIKNHWCGTSVCVHLLYSPVSLPSTQTSSPIGPSSAGCCSSAHRAGGEQTGESRQKKPKRNESDRRNKKKSQRK